MVTDQYLISITENCIIHHSSISIIAITGAQYTQYPDRELGRRDILDWLTSHWI